MQVLPFLVVFDLDGTLLDTAPDLLGALEALMIEEGVPLSDRAPLFPLCGKGGRALVEAGFRSAGELLPPARLDALTRRFITLYAARIAAETRPYPGALEALDRLTRWGARLAVCTNKRTDLARALLTALDLEKRFAAIIGGDHLPVRKPDPLHLFHTIESAGGTPARAVMIGDSDADLLAARGAGVPMIGVTFGYAPHSMLALGPDAVLDHYDALEEKLAAISDTFAAVRKKFRKNASSSQQG